MMSTHFTTYSRIATHRKCPQRYMYSYIDKLEKVDPEDVRVELEFGNWWHALRAADSIERGLEHESLQYVPERLGTVDSHPGIEVGSLEDLRAQWEHEGAVPIVAYVLKEADRWWQGRSEFEKESWQERLGGTLPDRLRYVDARWRERWADDLPHEHPLAVELHWERALPPLTDPETGEKKDPGATMTGYVDEVYYDARRNLVVVRDHKSHKGLGMRTSVEDMMDSQLQVYAWGASPLISEWGYGSVKAVAYDRVRSVAPKQPVVTSTGALSKAVADFDLTTYLSFSAGENGEGHVWHGAKIPLTKAEKDAEKAGETVERRTKPGGVYQTDPVVVEKLSDPAALSAWQQRTLTPLNRNIVTTHLRAAVDTSLDIGATHARAKETGAAGRNLTDMCKWCPFAELCRAQMTGGADGEYDLEAMYLRKRPASKR